MTAGQMLSAVIETEDGTAAPDGTHAVANAERPQQSDRQRTNSHRRIAERPR
ncbi:MAG: hypothetical protein ACLURV_14005 [Gallintestinimicrobium sp.]